MRPDAAAAAASASASGGGSGGVGSSAYVPSVVFVSPHARSGSDTSEVSASPQATPPRKRKPEHQQYQQYQHHQCQYQQYQNKRQTPNADPARLLLALSRGAASPDGSGSGSGDRDGAHAGVDPFRYRPDVAEAAQAAAAAAFPDHFHHPHHPHHQADEYETTTGGAADSAGNDHHDRPNCFEEV